MNRRKMLNNTHSPMLERRPCRIAVLRGQPLIIKKPSLFQKILQEEAVQIAHTKAAWKFPSGALPSFARNSWLQEKSVSNNLSEQC